MIKTLAQWENVVSKINNSELQKMVIFVYNECTVDTGSFDVANTLFQLLKQGNVTAIKMNAFELGYNSNATV